MFSRPNTAQRAGLGALLLVFASAAPAQPQLTLADAVTAAYQHHPERDLADAERNYAAALETRAAQPFAADPAFNLKYQTDEIGSGSGYREWEGGVALPLWWPGQKAAQQREAEGVLASADAMGAAKRLDIAAEVRERLWGVALARSGRDEAQLALDSAQQLEQDVARRVEAGELPRSDLLLAQKETVSRRDALQQAANRVQQAERLFQTYTGLDTVPPIQPEAASASSALPADHPRLVLAAAAVEKARAHRDRVAGERRAGPNLWLGGKQTRSTSDADYESSVGIEVSIPLGSKAQAAPALAEAATAYTQAQVEQQRTRLALQEGLDRATLELERTRQSLDRAREQLALADESLGLARRAFELGETDLVRLLQVRSDAIAAHQALEARRLELGQATARFNQALGVLPR